MAEKPDAALPAPPLASCMVNPRFTMWKEILLVVLNRQPRGCSIQQEENA